MGNQIQGVKEAINNIQAEEKQQHISEREEYIMSLANSIGEISDKPNSWGKQMYDHCVNKILELHGESEESAKIKRQIDIPWQKVQAETTLSDKESGEIKKEIFDLAKDRAKLLQSKAA